MLHPAPEGTTLVETIGPSTIFDVAIVRLEDRELISKRLVAPLRRELAARAAIVREARLLAHLDHPSFPRLVRVGQDGAGPFVIETRMPGVSLRAVIEGWRERGAQVPETLVRHVAIELSAAIAYLHELRVEGEPLEASHGDISPDNVRFSPDGAIGVIDFGSARLRGVDTSDAADRGTLPFAAPEVARGDCPPSQNADVYALAATILAVGLDGPISTAKSEVERLTVIGERGLDVTLVARAQLGETAKEAVRAALSLDISKRPRAQEFAAAMRG